MGAEVQKVPKARRIAQRWVAVCDDHTGFGFYNVKPRRRGSGYEPWRWIWRRTKRDAMSDARRHNAEHHSDDQAPEGVVTAGPETTAATPSGQDQEIEAS